MANKNDYDANARLLAYNGDSVAQYNIAKHFEADEVDIDQSIFWYRKAALQDHDLAIENARSLA